MSKIANHLATLYSWFSSPPMCERERNRFQVLVTTRNADMHTPGL